MAVADHGADADSAAVDEPDDDDDDDDDDDVDDDDDSEDDEGWVGRSPLCSWEAAEESSPRRLLPLAWRSSRDGSPARMRELRRKALAADGGTTSSMRASSPL